MTHQAIDQYFQNTFPDNRMEGETPLRQAQLVMLRMLKIFDHICKKHKLTYWLEAGTLLGAVRHHGFIPWDDDLDVSMLRKDYERFIRLAPDELPSDIFMQTEKSDPGYFNPAVPLKLRDKNSLLIEPHEVEDKHIHQGIFIDIFPYDTVPEKVSDYIKDKKRTKRLLKIKRAKLLPRRRAGSSYFKYKLISLGYSLQLINEKITDTIHKNNAKVSKYIGYGYDFSSPICIFPRHFIYPLSQVTFENAVFPAPANTDGFLEIKFGDYMQLPPESERQLRHAVMLKPILHDIMPLDETQPHSYSQDAIPTQ